MNVDDCHGTVKESPPPGSSGTAASTTDSACSTTAADAPKHISPAPAKGAGSSAADPVKPTAGVLLAAAGVTSSSVMRPHRIEVTADIRDAVDAAQGLLTGYYYQRDGRLVRQVDIQKMEVQGGVCRPVGVPVVAPVSVYTLLEHLGHEATWYRVNAKGQKEEISPPMLVVRALLDRGRWAAPVLVGIVNRPTLGPNCELLTEAGYDSGSGLLLVGSLQPPIPSNPTRADAQRAFDVLAEPYCEFPFQTPVDRAALVASILALAGRRAIPGRCPGQLVTGTTPGSGKSLVAQLAAVVGTGRLATLLTPVREEAELKRQLLGLAMAGDQAVLVDDCQSTLGSEVLSGTLTADEITDRPVGESRMVHAQQTAILFATGNNLRLRGTLGRRMLLCRLASDLEHPEDRKDFRYQNVLGWVHEHRGELIAAALTILRAFHLAGRPSHSRPPFGGFESWDSLVRGALIWAVGVDPLGNLPDLRAEYDEDLETLTDLLRAWQDQFPDRSVTAVDVWEKCGWSADLKAALLALTGSTKNDLDPRRIGRALGGVEGRVVGGRRLVRLKKRSGAGVLWVVEEVAGAADIKTT